MNGDWKNTKFRSVEINFVYPLFPCKLSHYSYCSCCWIKTWVYSWFEFVDTPEKKTISCSMEETPGIFHCINFNVFNIQVCSFISEEKYTIIPISIGHYLVKLLILVTSRNSNILYMLHLKNMYFHQSLMLNILRVNMNVITDIAYIEE